MRENKRQLGQNLMRQQLESSEQERAMLKKCLRELEGQMLRVRHLKTAQKVDRRENIKLLWRKGRKAPFVIRRWFDAIVSGNRVYFLSRDRQLWTYDISNKDWSAIPDCPYTCSSLVILNDLPTTIGGFPFTNKLVSLTTEGKNYHPCQLNESLQLRNSSDCIRGMGRKS